MKTAANDPTETAKSMSQAISRGGMKMADAELYTREKQRKRRRKSGAQYNLKNWTCSSVISTTEVIVLSFIAVTTLALVLLLGFKVIPILG